MSTESSNGGQEYFITFNGEEVQTQVQYVPRVAVAVDTVLVFETKEANKQVLNLFQLPWDF